MTPGQSDRPVETRVRRLVRRLEILEPDGRRSQILRVFCPYRHASVDSSLCATCPFVRAVSETDVTCAPPGIPEALVPALDAPLFSGPHALALATSVGVVCTPYSLAVRVDVPVVVAHALLDCNAIVVVLTANDEVCGILSAAKPPFGLMALGEIENRIRVLPEWAPLVEAFDLMLHTHERFVAVTGADRRFVGIVADLDVLRWAARHRQHPAPEQPPDSGTLCAHPIGTPETQS